MRYLRLLVLALSLPCLAMAAPDPVLYQKPAKDMVKDSRFGPLADFKRALATKAGACGVPVGSSFASARYDEQMASVMRRVLTCLHRPAQDSLGRTITIGVWQTIAPDQPVPTAKQRARALAFSAEGTDYSDIEFNLGTDDPGILTWGPLGATAGQAFQVQRILKAIDMGSKGLIDSAFGPEASAVRELSRNSTTSGATAIVQGVMGSPARRRAWRHGFAALAADRDARARYDEVMDAIATAGIPEAIADFYLSYWRYCWTPTEVDYGFFLDRAVQLDVRRAKTDAALAQAKAAEQRVGATFSAAQRRRAIAANFPAGNSKYVGDRLYRDVAFYLDGVGPANLSDPSLWSLRANPAPRPAGLINELKGWRGRMGVTAANYGLSDERPAAVPDGIQSQAPACAASRLGVP